MTISNAVPLKSMERLFSFMLKMILREGFYTLWVQPASRLAGGGETGMQVRVAKACDAGAIVSVINAAFRVAEGFLIDRDRIDMETVQELFRKGTFLVAEDTSVCGCVYVEPREAGRSYLGLLAVEPHVQKAGLGSQLMHAAEGYCAQAGSRFMDLRIVSVRKELPAFYHRQGYVETGTGPLRPG